MKLSIIYVNYQTSDFLQQSLQTLFTSIGHISSEICIVDNQSWDDTLTELQKKYPSIHFLKNNNNVGFAKACNLALRQSKGEFVLFLNPDVYLRHDTLSLLLTYMKYHKKIGILAPQLRYQNNFLQYSCRRYPTLSAHLLKMLHIKARTVRQYLLQDNDHSRIQDVDWLLGAFLLTRKKMLQEIGSFDERFFLYFEDIDLCRRAKEAGWRVVYYPKAVATHLYQQSSHRLFCKPFFHHLMSMYKYYRKYGFRL